MVICTHPSTTILYELIIWGQVRYFGFLKLEVYLLIQHALQVAKSEHKLGQVAHKKLGVNRWICLLKWYQQQSVEFATIILRA